MLTPLTIALLSGAFVSAVIFFGLGIWSTRRHLRLARTAAQLDGASYPPISLLKPVKGLEEDLEANLRTFFEQDYPAALEIVFSAEEPATDEGIAVARRVAAEYPNVPVRFVASNPDFGLNPKVANLEGARAGARHDLVFQSDANVRLRPDYLRRVVAELLTSEASLLSSIIVGVGERSIGAALENLQLTALIAPSVCTALHVGRTSCVIGKSMLFHRSELASLGGLEAVRNVLCEDFILGQIYQGSGKKVLLSTTTVENVNHDTPVDRFLSRHSRWLKMRAVIHFGSFVADLFANPVAWCVGVVIASRFEPWALALLVAAFGCKLVTDAYFMRVFRPAPMALGHLLLSPFKDLAMPFVWVYCLFSRSVTWRGRKLRFGARSRLREDDGILPVRMARKLLG
jgi:ceramide glucosyltransferase